MRPTNLIALAAAALTISGHSAFCDETRTVKVNLTPDRPEPRFDAPIFYKTRNTTQPRSPRQSWFKKSSKR